MNSPALKAIAYFEENKKHHLDDLADLVKIPSVSFPGFDPRFVREAAHATEDVLIKRGFQNVHLLEIEGAHPAVYGEIIIDKSKPTVLLYAHHDVQPAGDTALWHSDPFTAVERNGRLFGRGTADDKGGIVIHTAAVESWMKAGTLPLNVKIFIEGEEEYGSEHLPLFLDKYKELLKSDYMILTDTSNLDSGVPAITTQLRGLVAFDITVSSTKQALHSGMWGGPIPDPVMGLCKALATLTDDQGDIALKELINDVRVLSEKRGQQLRDLPINKKDFREQSGMLETTVLLDDNMSPFYRIWEKPALAINAIQASSQKEARNILCEKAYAKVGVRIVPNMSGEKTLSVLKDHLKKNVPWGLTVEFGNEVCGSWWETNTDHPAFEAATKALSRGYGCKAHLIGCGASIPFVEPMSTQLGGIPALLIGIEDPYSNAHGENESLNLSDWEKAVKSAIFLYEELSLLK